MLQELLYDSFWKYVYFTADEARRGERECVCLWETDTFGVPHLLQPSTLSKPDLDLRQGQRTLKWPAVFQLKGDSYLSWGQMRAHFQSWRGQ